MGKTSIQWTDHSINPIRARHRVTGAVGHYCEKISTGCARCYASTLQKRFQMPDYPGQTKGGSLCLGETETVHVGDLEVFLDESKLDAVLRRKKPTKYFWCDMTDMFGWWVYEEWIDKCFAVMAMTPHHTHQILTKRPERAFEYLGTPDRHNTLEVTADDLRPGKGHPSFGGKHMLPGLPFENVWLGVSVENQKAVDERIPHLLKTPAAVRFLSCEPLLGPLDLSKYLLSDYDKAALDTQFLQPPGGFNFAKVNWVIIGGESGQRARPLDIQWVRDIRDQCEFPAAACFVKQLGAKPFEEQADDGHLPQHVRDLARRHGVGPLVTKVVEYRLKDSHGGDWDEWPEDLRVREFPRSARALTGG